jgi:hypothetical protein
MAKIENAKDVVIIMDDLDLAVSTPELPREIWTAILYCFNDDDLAAAMALVRVNTVLYARREDWLEQMNLCIINGVVVANLHQNSPRLHGLRICDSNTHPVGTCIRWELYDRGCCTETLSSPGQRGGAHYNMIYTRYYQQRSLRWTIRRDSIMVKNRRYSEPDVVNTPRVANTTSMFMFEQDCEIMDAPVGAHAAAWFIYYHRHDRSLLLEAAARSFTR